MKSLRHFTTLVLLALACATANAALIVNVEGVRGSGQITVGSQTGLFYSGNHRTRRTRSPSLSVRLSGLGNLWRPRHKARPAKIIA